MVAASPDSRVFDPSSSPDGLIKPKNNPSTAKKLMSEKGQNALDTNHDYFYQVQCQLYCTQSAWCDFVIRANKKLYMYIKRIFIEMIHGGRSSF